MAHDKGSNKRGGKPQRGKQPSGSSPGRSSSDRTGKQGKPKKQYSATTRSVEAERRQKSKRRRRDLKGAAVNLPNWVIEEVERATRADRVAPTLEELGAASEALGEGRYQAAVKHANRAKALSPQNPTIRETLGVASYRLGDWKTALDELRTFRRMSGELTHLPIEMDVARALGRSKDVEAGWSELNKRGAKGLTLNEGKVVYGSYLLDQGRPGDAWKVVDPGRIVDHPNEGHLRLYFVAARTAAALGDLRTARKLADTIVLSDPSFPGWDELEGEIASASTEPTG